MFKRHGNSVSLEKIAQEAGVGVATLYRNFPDREALIHACAEHMSDGFLVFQNRLIEDFESDPSDAENFVLDYALKLTTMGLTSLIPPLRAGRLRYPAGAFEIEARRVTRKWRKVH